MTAFPLASYAASNQFIAAFAKEASLSDADAKRTADAMFSVIRSELREGREVTVGNFGRFSVTERNARKARNPRTGETIDVKPRRYAKFMAAEGLRNELNPELAARKSQQKAKIPSHRAKGSEEGGKPQQTAAPLKRS